MEDEISSILTLIREKYSNARADHMKHYSCHLKSVGTFTLLESVMAVGDSAGLGSNGKQVFVTYSSLFNGEYATLKLVLSKTILVQGEAGVGKTMLCMSILEDWATGKLFQEYQIMLYLPLRNVASAASLPELLNALYSNFSSDTCAKLANYLENNKENNILIIADGWEDLPPLKCQAESFFHSLLFSSDVISASVIITIKPHRMQNSTLQLIDRFVALAGFDKEAIESIIHSEFEGDIRKIRYLIVQLNNNPLLMSTCSIPLNLAILCKMYRTDDTEPLPNTMTELYAKLVWTLIATTIRSNDSYKITLRLSKYNDLPEQLQRPWHLLCELAFRNIEKGHEAFSQSDDLMHTSSDIKLISHFGLTKPVVQSGDIQILSISFLHPCFEQYLASLHLALQPHEALLTLMQKLPVSLEGDSKVISTFWHFFISNYVIKVNSGIIAQTLKIISTATHSDKASYFLILCHLSFEAKHPVVNEEIFKSMDLIDKKVLKFGNCHDVYDCIAMIYVIESITHEYEIEINFQDCSLNPEHIHNFANVLAEKSDKLQVRGLNLSNNRLNDSLAVDFFRRTTAIFKFLRILILCSCEIGTSSDIQAILSALTESSCQTLIHLDLSFNPISMSFLEILQSHIQKNATYDILQTLSFKGSFKTDISIAFLSRFCDTLSSRCKYLRRLDLSNNNLGEPGNPDLRRVISQLLSLGRDFHLCLNEEYMSEVNDEFICVMEETIKNKGTINHTIAHGVIVGPGRSGKNTLMSRLLGNGPPNPNLTSPSTGVLENVVKVEVKKLSTVATAVSNNLEWMKLKHDEEALELIMTTARHHSAAATRIPALKYVLYERKEDNNACKNVQSSYPPKYPVSRKQRKKYKMLKFFKALNKLKAGRRNKSPVAKNEEEIKNVVVYKPDIEPVDIFKRAVKLRGMDALREHLESSWSLYLTNTGGQIEFQEYLPLLVCGPSIFFITFPLHYDLEKPYNVRYEYPDGRVEEYKSPSTLLEELLQTLATINAFHFTSGQQRNYEPDPNLKPKLFFIGTHKDCLSADTAEESIQKKDKLLQDHVRQTSLFRQGSIQFFQAPERLIFAVNNLSVDNSEFQKIRLAVQQTVEKNEFTIECPSSWLILSLILRAKHKSDQVLSFEKCYSVAQECGITNHSELKQALCFIHSRLGLIRYFNTDDLNELVVIDPQILFDRITDLIIKTFTRDNVEVNEMEDFRQRGIIPLVVMKKLSDKNHSDSQLPFMWLTRLLNYLRIAALFTDNDGDKYFFPSALCHAPIANPNSPQSFTNIWPPLLVGFESGFCPRGIPGALIKYLMTNEMKSKTSWDIIPNKIFKNQVSFAIQGHEIITLRILPTHLEIICECENSDAHSETDTIENTLTKKTCELAYVQIRKGMRTVTSQCKECNFFWGFYCTLTSICKVQHPAKIQWDDKNNPFKLVCKVTNKRGNLPKNYEIWSLQRNPNPGKTQLDREIDACNNGILKHLGEIADSMTEWEGKISEELQLTAADVASILTQFPNKLKLQTRAALQLWKQRHGSDATYQKLIKIFESAGYHNYAEIVKNVASGVRDETDDFSDYDEPLPQPETYPNPKLNLPSSPKLSTRRFLPCDEYVQINPAAAQDLPKGDVYNQNVLDSYDTRSVVPLLSSKEPQVKPADSAAVTVAPSPSLESIENHEWFFGKITHSEADTCLMTPFNQYGSYLIRSSETNPGQYVLSLRDKRRIRHYRIHQLEDGSFCIDGDRGVTGFTNIVDLVTYYQHHAGGLPVRLIHHCKKHEIDPRQISLIAKLREGEFSEVWNGFMDGVNPVAVTIHKPQSMTKLDFLQMASLMLKLHHPNIIQLYGVCTENDPLYIITEPLEYGSLLDYLHKEKPTQTFGYSQLIDMSLQVVEGMAYLEKQKCIHRDLAARNIQLVGENLSCKVANFERAKNQDTFEAYDEIWTTYRWTAPEAAIQKKYSIKSDVWSFGIVLYEIITYGDSPYPGISDDAVLRHLQQGYRMHQPPDCPFNFFNIMRDCWHYAPEYRPTFKTLQLQLKQVYVNITDDLQHAIFANPVEVLHSRQYRQYRQRI